MKFQNHEQPYIVEKFRQNHYQGWTSSKSPQIGRLQAVPRTPLSPHWQPQKERLYSRQLDWLAEQGGAPDRQASGCAKNPPVTPLATPKREWVRYQSVFCICVFASNPVQEKKFLFFVFKIPYDDSYFSVFYPSQIKAY